MRHLDKDEHAAMGKALRDSVEVVSSESAALVGYVPDWTNVKERLPDSERLVVCWHTGMEDYVFAFFRDGVLPFDMPDYGWDSDNEITHWAELPSPRGT